MDNQPEQNQTPIAPDARTDENNSSSASPASSTGAVTAKPGIDLTRFFN